MPRGFSDGFLKPKKDGKGDPRLKYKVGDFIRGRDIDLVTGVEILSAGGTGYTQRVACPMNGLDRGLALGTNNNNNFQLMTITRPASGLLAGSYILIATNLFANLTSGVAVDQNDNVYFQCQTASEGIRKFNKNGVFSTVNTAASGNSLTCDQVESLFYISAANTVRRMDYMLAVQATIAITGVGLVFASKFIDGFIYSRTESNIKYVGLRRTDGTLVWETVIPGTINNIKVDELGNVYTTSLTTVVKLNSDGEILWQSAAISTFAYHFIPSVKGGVVLCATSSANSMYGNVWVLDIDTGAPPSSGAAAPFNTPNLQMLISSYNLSLFNNETEVGYLDSATKMCLRKIAFPILG